MSRDQQTRLLAECAGCCGEFVVGGAMTIRRVFALWATPEHGEEHRTGRQTTHQVTGADFSALLCDECDELVTVAELLKYEHEHPFPLHLRKLIAWRRSWREFWRHR